MTDSDTTHVPADILSRIRKLLRLASGKGTTEAEAALAADKAQRLLDEYKLAQASIDIDGATVAPDPLGQTAQPTGFKNIPRWATWLASAVAKSSYTGVYLQGGSLVWVGTQVDVLASRDLWTFLREQCERERARYTPSDPWVNVRRAREDFIRACSRRVCERLKAAYQARRQAHAPSAPGDTSRALLVLDTARQRVDAYYARLPLTKGRASYRRPESSAAQAAGRAAGDRVRLQNADRIGSGTRPLRLTRAE